MIGMDYKVFRRKYPHLKLPQWEELMQRDKDRLNRMTEEELIGLRTARLLVRDPGQKDPVNATRWASVQAGEYDSKIF